VYRGSPPHSAVCQTILLVPRKALLVGLDETQSCTREDYRGALTDINGDYPLKHL